MISLIQRRHRATDAAAAVNHPKAPLKAETLLALHMHVAVATGSYPCQKTSRTFAPSIADIGRFHTSSRDLIGSGWASVHAPAR